ncbi:MAG: recombination-associated protein RdgC [Kiritimatiellae bacterium]|nr:recombination-associated protein RdgC [Kiritimatiellia bacterium]
MGFDSGKVGFRLFYLQEEYDSSLVEKFAENIAPPVESLDMGAITGWVGGRYLLDREISDATCVIGSYLYVQLFKAERKIPPQLLRALAKREEFIAMKAAGTSFLPRKEKAAIKERLTAELLPKMPPTLNGIPVVVDFRNQLLVAEALSDKQIDALCPAFKAVAGSVPILLTPETAALKRKQINANDLDPVSFTPDASIPPPATPTLGQDFLTWLWYLWEREGNVWHLEDGREFGLLLEGPVTFYRDGEGAHEALLRKGTPLNSAEAGAALQCGKKVKKLKLSVAQGEDVFECTFDDEFAFRSVKLPKGQQKDFEPRVEERMLFIETFFTAVLTLFDKFLDLRSNPASWKKTLGKIQEWVQNVGSVRGE